MQYRTAHQVHCWTLAVAVIAATAMIILLTLDLGDSTFHVPISVYITVAATGAASSVGWIASRCTICVMRHADERFAELNKRADDRMNHLADSIDKIRATISDFSGSVAEYAEQRAIAARLETMQHLVDRPTPGDGDRIVTHIGRQASR